MKVNPIQGVPTPFSAKRVTGRARTGNAARDEVTFSENALEFSKLMQNLREETVRTPEQQARVDDLKQRIDAGLYSIEADIVAQNILAVVGVK